MADPADVSEPPSLVPSRTLLVVLAQNGLSVPNPRGWSIPADLTRLRLIEAVATGAETRMPALLAYAVDDDPDRRMALAMFVNSLETAELMLRGSDPAIRTEPDEVARSPVPRDQRRPMDEPWVVDAPLVFAVTANGFELFDHEGGRSACLQATEVDALAAFCEPSSSADAYERHRLSAGDLALSEDRFQELARDLHRTGALRSFDATDVRDVVALGVGRLMAKNEATAYERLLESVDRGVIRHEDAERSREARTGRKRVRVVPVTYNGTLPPLALGLLFTYAKAYDGGRLEELYNFHPGWLTDETRLADLAEEPGVFLFSNYVWSHERCLQSSAIVKERNPASITVHGGPSTPKYEGDVEEYFRRYPHVDVVVHGEGEATTAHLLDVLSQVFEGDQCDLSALGEVPGLSFRLAVPEPEDGLRLRASAPNPGYRVVRTADRERIVDLDSIPSPYLTGLFDAYAQVPRLSATLETNRGCPYGCTFCDWGSATLSRIRKFDLDRVMAELEWCAEHEVISVGLTDANFGIWERDVAITEKVVELKKRCGFPTGFGANYAKNTTKHLTRIIEMLVKAGIISQGVLALQSMDEATLEAIERSNIRLDKYEELAREFRLAKLPLFVDLMVGLPGQTLESFKNDLQQCADREVQARLPITQMLVNSPMNEPSYREKHRIVLTASPVGPEQPRVIATSTFTEDDYERMLALRSVFILGENLGVLRQVARYVRHETGTREVDFYSHLLDQVEAEPEQWPHLTMALKIVPIVMAPPVSWHFMIDELRRYLVEVLGIADDSALRTVLEVQHALLPAQDRTFPVTIELSHDYAAWFDAMTDAKERGDRDTWPAHVPPLRSLPRATFTVDDPNGIVTGAGIGAPFEFHGTGLHWELQSPLARMSVEEDQTIAALIVST